MPGLPITIHLTTTDINKDVTWDLKGNGNNHGSDDVFPKVTVIRNPILDLPPNSEFYRTLNGVGTIRPNESQSIGNISSGGGVYFSQVTVPLQNTAVNNQNSFDVTQLARDFMNNAGASGFTQMNTIISADGTQEPLISPSFANNESKWIEYQDTPIDVHDSNFYTKFGYISFFSAEDRFRAGFTATDEGYARSYTIGSGTGLIKMRKDFNYKYVSIPLTEVSGIVTTAAGPPAIHSIQLINPLWGNLGLSAGSLVSFQESISTANTNETITAVASPGGIPPTYVCGNRTAIYDGNISGDGRTISLTTIGSKNSLFINGTLQLTGNVAVADSNFGIGNPNPRYFADPNSSPPPTATVPPSLVMRFKNAVNVGSKNLLEVQLTSTASTKFFGATADSPSMGFTAGSYVQISGFSNAANNGIFQVINVYDGVPGDSNYKSATNTNRYQYLELSRQIIGETPTGSSNIVIRNVSKLPLLHIKYTTRV